MSTQVIAPVGFFTYDAFRAGWFFVWRLCLYLSPALVLNAIGYWMMFEPFLASGLMQDPARMDPQLVLEAASSQSFVIGSVLVGLSFLGAFIASIPLTTRIARTWAQRTWNRTFERGVWWAILWRVFLVSLLAAVIMMGLLVVGGVVTAATGLLVGLVLNLAVNCLWLVVILLAYGWAMARVVASRIGGGAVASTVIAGLNPLGYAPTTGPQYAAPPRPAPVTPLRTPPTPGPAMPSPPTSAAPPAPPAPVMTPRAPAPPPPPPPAPSGAAATGRRQCPKCNLYETEKGSVLGWYCKVCGWRETRA